tara:strand:+ start:76 stop:267 length:192 start_codon:yes stop_codon:yes gene_type:complete
MKALLYLTLSMTATLISYTTHSIMIWLMCAICVVCVALVGTAEPVVELDYDCDEKVLRVNLRG